MEELNTDKSFHAASLIVKYLRGELAETGKEELEVWRQESDNNQQLFDSLANPDELEAQLKAFEKTGSGAGWQRLQNKLEAKKKKERKNKNRKIWWQAAAAVFILMLAIGQVWFHRVNKPVAKDNMTARYEQDIQPGTFKAELILSDGKTVSLDNKEDTSFTENGSTVQRTGEGIIKYEKTGRADDPIAWNTLHIPNAGEYVVVLEDGTKVWLNAATRLRYPVQFKGNERRVELLEGEAYFEVAKNKEKPFIVVADQMEIKAVGTAFNVNNYPNANGSIITTLAEGKVKVKTKENAGFLLPGEQANAEKKKMQIMKADVEQVTAWKNGLFIYANTPLPEVMQQLARWYNVKIEYDKAFKEKKFFTGEIKRNVPVSKLLQMMELTGIARFRITNNTVVVLPYSS